MHEDLHQPTPRVRTRAVARAADVRGELALLGLVLGLLLLLL